MLDLQTLSGTSICGSRAADVNSVGQVVGQREGCTGPHDATGFTWTDTGGMVPIPNSANATAVSDDGRVVGSGFGNYLLGNHALTWTSAGGAVNLGSLGGFGGYDSASDVNDNGQVVGSARTASGHDHAFVWTPATGMLDLGTLGGNESSAAAVNENGWIVGWSTTTAGPISAIHAALWTTAAWVPDAPTDVVADAGDGQATVSFTPPPDGGSAITYYRVTAAPGGQSAYGTASPITVYGLQTGTSYTFTVTATNTVVTSSASAPSNAVTPESPEREHPDLDMPAPRAPVPDFAVPDGPRPRLPGH